MIKEIKKHFRETGFEFKGKTEEGISIFENTVKRVRKK